MNFSHYRYGSSMRGHPQSDGALCVKPTKQRELLLKQAGYTPMKNGFSHTKELFTEQKESLGTAKELETAPADSTKDTEKDYPKLTLYDVPGSIKKPELDRYYERFLGKRSFLQFISQHQCFAVRLNIEKILEEKSKLQPLAFGQLASYAIQPWSKYGILGFHTQQPGIDDRIQEIKDTQKRSLKGDAYSFICIKIDSIHALHLVATGKLKSAEELIERLEKEVVLREACDLTAWFHVAHFWLSLKQAQLITGFKPNKEGILNSLRKARDAFLADDKGYFAWEASLILWWMFVVQAELISYASSEFPSPPEIHDVGTDIFEASGNILEQFYKERRRLDVYPRENPTQQRIVKIFHQISDAVESCPKQQGETQTESEQTPFLADVYQQYIAKTRRNVPQCIQRSVKCDKDGKITIYSDSTDSAEFEEFLQLIEYERYKAYFEIQKIRPITLFGPFANSGNNKYNIKEHMTPGGVVFPIPIDWWMDERLDKNFDTMCQPMVSAHLRLSFLWTIGLLVSDSVSEKKYILTCCHSVPEEKLRDGEREKLVFLSAHSKRNAYTGVTQNVVDKISSGGFLGYYGGYENEAGDTNLIDILLLPVDDKFLNQSNVDMVYRDRNASSSPMNMAIYTEDLTKLLGQEVFMHGSVSGTRVGRIVDTDIDMITIKGVMCKGGFAVELKEKYKTSDNQSLAREGDSGALIFGRHPETTQLIAIGLVWGGSEDIHKVGSTGEIFYHLTYCASLKFGKCFLSEKYKKNIEYHIPQCAKDSGISSMSNEEALGDAGPSTGNASPPAGNTGLSAGNTNPSADNTDQSVDITGLAVGNTSLAVTNSSLAVGNIGLAAANTDPEMGNTGLAAGNMGLGTGNTATLKCEAKDQSPEQNRYRSGGNGSGALTLTSNTKSMATREGKFAELNPDLRQDHAMRSKSQDITESQGNEHGIHLRNLSPQLKQASSKAQNDSPRQQLATDDSFEELLDRFEIPVASDFMADNNSITVEINLKANSVESVRKKTGDTNPPQITDKALANQQVVTPKARTKKELVRPRRSSGESRRSRSKTMQRDIKSADSDSESSCERPKPYATWEAAGSVPEKQHHYAVGSDIENPDRDQNVTKNGHSKKRSLARSLGRSLGKFVSKFKRKSKSHRSLLLSKQSGQDARVEGQRYRSLSALSLAEEIHSNTRDLEGMAARVRSLTSASCLDLRELPPEDVPLSPARTSQQNTAPETIGFRENGSCNSLVSDMNTATPVMSDHYGDISSAGSMRSLASHDH